MFERKGVSGATGAELLAGFGISGLGVTALDHEAGDDPVEKQVIEESVFRQFFEIITMGGGGIEEDGGHIAKRGLDFHKAVFRGEDLYLLGYGMSASAVSGGERYGIITGGEKTIGGGSGCGRVTVSEMPDEISCRSGQVFERDGQGNLPVGTVAVEREICDRFAAGSGEQGHREESADPSAVRRAGCGYQHRGGRSGRLELDQRIWTDMAISAAGRSRWSLAWLAIASTTSRPSTTWPKTV